MRPLLGLLAFVAAASLVLLAQAGPPAGAARGGAAPARVAPRGLSPEPAPGLGLAGAQTPAVADAPAAPAAGAPPAPQAADELATIVGRVYLDRVGDLRDDELDRAERVAGAAVEVQADDGGPALRAVSGPEGTFVLRLPRPRWQALVAAKAQVLACAPGRVTARAALPGEERLVRLVLLERGVPLEGRVVAPTGQPIANAEVRVSGCVRRELGPLGRTTTGPDGRFTLEGLPTGLLGPAFGEVTLQVRAGDASRRQVVTVGAGPVEVELTPPAPAELRLRIESDTAVRVLADRHRADGEPGDLVRTEAAELTLPCAEGDWFDIQLTGHRVEARRLAVRVPCEPVVVRMAPPRGGFTGQAVGPDGAPAAGHLVRGVWWRETVSRDDRPARPGVEERELAILQFEATTSDDGSFTFPGVPAAGRLRLMNGSRGDLGEVAAAAGPVKLTLVEPGSCAVRLRLVDEGGARLAGAEVNGSGRCEAGGVFEVDLRGPSGWLDLEAPGRFCRIPVSDVRPFAPLELGDVLVARAGAVEVTVTWPEVPLWKANVEWERGAGPGRGRAFGCGQPTLVIERLAPGQPTLVLSATRLDGLRHEVRLSPTVVAGHTTRVEVDLRHAPLVPARATRP